MPSVSAPDAGCPAQSGFLFGNEHPLIKQKNIPFLKHTSPMHDSGSTQEGLDESRVSDVHPSVEDRRLLNEVAELTIESDQVPEALEVEVESMHQLERETTVHPSSHSISNFTEQKQSVPAEGASVEDALRTQESLGDGSSLAAITKHLSKLHVARIYMTKSGCRYNAPAQDCQLAACRIHTRNDISTIRCAQVSRAVSESL